MLTTDQHRLTLSDVATHIQDDQRFSYPLNREVLAPAGPRAEFCGQTQGMAALHR